MYLSTSGKQACLSMQVLTIKLLLTNFNFKMCLDMKQSLMLHGRHLKCEDFLDSMKYFMAKLNSNSLA